MFKEEINYPKQEVADKEYCEKIVAKSIEKVEASGIEIGYGKTAKILISEMDPKICMKAIGEKKISRNDASEEMEFLDKLSLKGRRVPKPVCAVMTDKKDYLFMETVEGGLSIEDILKDKSGKILEKVSKTFDFKNFFMTLREEIKKMHEEDRIYHRDLHAGNIMIDSDGQPVIIDFGDAGNQYLSSEDPYRSVNGKGEIIRYPVTDEQHIANIYKEFGRYLTDHNFLKY